MAKSTAVKTRANKRGAKATAALEPDIVPAGERDMRAYLERALVQGDLGMTAVSMSGAQPPQRKGNIEVMRAYSTGPWLRGSVGRISTSVASIKWRLFAAPADSAERARMRPCLAERALMGRTGLLYDDVLAHGFRMGEAPTELRDIGPRDRFGLIREMKREGNLVEILRHPWNALMAQPNAVMTGRVARQVTVASYDLVGDAMWVLGGAGAAPDKAWPIPGVWIQRRPTIDEPWWVIQIGAGSSSANATVWNVPWDAALLFNDPDPLQPYGRGVGTGFSLGDEVDIDEAASKTISAFFHNGAMPATLVSIKGAKKDALERAKKDWNNHLQGFKKAYKAHFTGGEIDVQRMDTTFKEMALVDLRDAQRRVFQRVYGIPPEIMGDNDSSSWATSSAAKAIFASEVEIPRAEVMREQFQRLAYYFDQRLIVEYDDPTPINLENRREVMKTMPGYFRVDEVRALADEEPTGDVSGRGFIVDNVWVGALTNLSPPMEQFDVMGGLVSVDERREYLRLPPRGPDNGGDEPAPTRVGKTGAVTPTDTGALSNDVGSDAPGTEDGSAPVTTPADGSPAVTAPTDGSAPAVPEAAPVQDQAMNGAQVQALQAIVDQVVAGDLPPESAKAMIQIAFPTISDELIDAMLDPIEDFEPPAKPTPPPSPFGVAPAPDVQLDPADGDGEGESAADDEDPARAGVSFGGSSVAISPFRRARRAKPLVDRPVRADKEHVSPDMMRLILAGVDVTSLYDAMLPEVRALVGKWGQETLDGLELETTPTFNSESAKVRAHLRELGTERIGGMINPTTRDRLHDAIRAAERDWHDQRAAFLGRSDVQRVDDFVHDEVRADPVSFEDAISQSINDVFDSARDGRAAGIGRTESTYAAGFATDDALAQAPVDTEKEWISIDDDAVRETHEEMDGQRRAPGDDFDSPSGASGPHPGALGEPEEDINCRCVVGTVVLDKDTKGDKRHAIGHRVFGGADREARRAAWRTADKALQQYDARIASAVRDGFDKQQVRCIGALKDALR